MKYIYIFLFLVMPSCLLAQANYNAGYVIKSNGDTVKGYIDFREWENTPRLINFKTNLSDKKEIRFSPAAVRSFQINGLENYISFEGNISMDKIDFPDLPTALDTTTQHDVIFLRQLVTGKYLTLYYNGDKIKKRYFVAELNRAPVELKYHEYYIDGNTTSKSIFYKVQLVRYATKYNAGNERVTKNIDKMPFGQEELEQIVNQINGTKADKKKSTNSRFLFGVGINDIQTQVGDNIKNATTISPKLSFGLDLFNNVYIQQLIFRTEVSFSYATPKFTYSYGDTYTFNQYTATITPQIIYNVYNRDKFKVYLGVGVNLNFSTYSNNKQYIGFGQVVNNPYDLASYWGSFPTQVGAVFSKRIEVFFCYTSFSTYTHYIGFYVENESFTTGVKYLMK